MLQLWLVAQSFMWNTIGVGCLSCYQLLPGVWDINGPLICKEMVFLLMTRVGVIRCILRAFVVIPKVDYRTCTFLLLLATKQ